MGSWRENVSEAAQNDLDEMFEYGLNAAVFFLNKSREFYPFGNYISKDGELKPVMTYDGNENPLSADVIESLKKSFAAMREELRAAVIISDVTINTGGSAVCLTMEHVQGIALQIVIPYEFKGVFKKTVNLLMESASTSLAERTIWSE